MSLRQMKGWSITPFRFSSKTLVEEEDMPNITSCKRGLSLLVTYYLLGRFGWTSVGHMPISESILASSRIV